MFKLVNNSFKIQTDSYTAVPEIQLPVLELISDHQQYLQLGVHCYQSLRDIYRSVERKKNPKHVHT